MGGDERILGVPRPVAEPISIRSRTPTAGSTRVGSRKRREPTPGPGVYSRPWTASPLGEQIATTAEDTMSNASEPLAWARRLAGLGLITALGLSLVACGGDDEDDATDSGDSTEEPADSGSDSGGDPYGDDEGSDDAGAGDAAGGGEYQITAIEYTDATAAAGSTLEIVDSSGAAHTFTADDGAFDVPVSGGGTASLDVPAEPGDYPFHCEIHSSMQATLTVE
jgi:plastocyanin